MCPARRGALRLARDDRCMAQEIALLSLILAAAGNRLLPLMRSHYFAGHSGFVTWALFAIMMCDVPASRRVARQLCVIVARRLLACAVRAKFFIYFVRP